MKITALTYKELQTDPAQLHEAVKLFNKYLKKIGNNWYWDKISGKDHREAFGLMMSYNNGVYNSEIWYRFATA